ncbi:hypothetical protein ACOR62_07465 [Neisseria lisongii]|uniref:DUF3108 domain-containing protein n=1 Tax=Neisseria lisongii TaxID=2912188 RepID=A0AAW5AJY9_9NEIS|nr:hypothetical protein [Neisseria lisongii]MCF7530212.1 hypothetical protein [Neisseria lisongii]
MMKKSALLFALLAALGAVQPAAASDDRRIVARSWAKDDLGNRMIYSAQIVRDPWYITVAYGDHRTNTMKQYTWDGSNMNVRMNHNSAKIGRLYYEDGSGDMYVEAALRKWFKPAHYFKHIGQTADFSEQVIRISCYQRRVATLTETYYLGKKMVYQNLTRPDPLIWREFDYEEMEQDLGRELCFL